MTGNTISSRVNRMSIALKEELKIVNAAEEAEVALNWFNIYYKDNDSHSYRETIPTITFRFEYASATAGVKQANAYMQRAIYSMLPEIRNKAIKMAEDDLAEFEKLEKFRSDPL